MHCVLFLALLVVTNVRSLQVPQLQQVGQLALLFSLTFALLCCPFALGGPAGAHAGAAAVPATADQGSPGSSFWSPSCPMPCCPCAACWPSASGSWWPPRTCWSQLRWSPPSAHVSGER